MRTAHARSGPQRSRRRHPPCAPRLRRTGFRHPPERARPAGVRADRGAARVIAPRRQRRPRDHRPDAAGDPEGPARAQRLHAGDAVRRRLADRLRASDRQLPALAAGRDRPGQRRRARARRPCRAVLRAGAVVLFPREPRLARPGTAHDRAVDGAGRDPLLRAGELRERFHGHGRPGDPPRGRGDGRRHRARDRARRRTGNAGRQRSLGARTRLYRQRSAHPRAAAGHRPSARQPGRPGRAGAQRHLRRADRPAPRHRADLGRDRLARRRGRQKHHQRAGRARRPHHFGALPMPATT